MLTLPTLDRNHFLPQNANYMFNLFVNLNLVLDLLTEKKLNNSFGVNKQLRESSLAN